VNIIPNNLKYLIHSSYQHNIIYEDVYCVDISDLLSLSVDDRLLHLNYFKKEYKILVILFWEEFFYNSNIDNIINYSLKIDLPLFIFSKNPVLDKFLKITYNSDKLFSISPDMLFLNTDDLAYYTNSKIKNIKLLFLNYNRKVNRDYIICKLKEKNELFNNENYISFHNYDFCNDEYKLLHDEYIIENNIDVEYLKNLKIIPDAVNVDNQLITQQNSFELYSRSKFNIICEPFFGYSKDKNSFNYYNHLITKKTILPLLFKNVFFIHEYNSLLSDCLKEIGFEMFFNNLDDFLNNMNDDYLELESTKNKLFNNQNLAKTLIINEKKKFSETLKKIINEL
jgi:hypothetical protein